MRELYKEAEAEEEKAKVKVAAKEAFSDGLVGPKNGKGGIVEKGGEGKKRKGGGKMRSAEGAGSMLGTESKSHSPSRVDPMIAEDVAADMRNEYYFEGRWGD